MVMAALGPADRRPAAGPRRAAWAMGFLDHRGGPDRRSSAWPCFIAFDWVQGIFWFMAKTYFFIFVFVWMRATLPRVRVDQLMGFAWKWLLPASLLNLFVTAAAVIILNPSVK